MGQSLRQGCVLAPLLLSMFFTAVLRVAEKRFLVDAAITDNMVQFQRKGKGRKKGTSDQGYGRGGTPIFSGVFEPLARVTLYLTDENGLGSCFGAAWITFALRIDFVNVKHEENVRSHRNKGVTRASDP